MKYQAGTWTCPTTNKRMTDEEYFLAVGALIKCETCGKVVSCTHVCPSKNSNENRVDWLQTQPRDAFGKPLREDDRNECSALISILDEKIAEVRAL